MNEEKTYDVTVSYSAGFRFSVEAESEEEAKEIAEQLQEELPITDWETRYEITEED